MKLIQIKIDNKNPAVQAYQRAYRNAYDKLTPEQKSILEENAIKTNIQNPILRDKVLKGSSLKKIISKILPSS
jgi:hypothetical protein